MFLQSLNYNSNVWGDIVLMGIQQQTYYSCRPQLNQTGILSVRLPHLDMQSHNHTVQGFVS